MARYKHDASVIITALISSALHHQRERAQALCIRHAQGQITAFCVTTVADFYSISEHSKSVKFKQKLGVIITAHEHHRVSPN